MYTRRTTVVRHEVGRKGKNMKGYATKKLLVIAVFVAVSVIYKK